MKCGTDICSVNRIKEAIELQGRSFLERVFTDNEINYCEKYKTTKYERYAGRFAAKEAVYKAISPPQNNNGVFTEVEIINDENGKPRAFLHGELAKLANEYLIDISISHEREFAIAMCVSRNEI